MTNFHWEQSLKNELNFLQEAGKSLFGRGESEDIVPRCRKCGEVIDPESPEDDKCNSCCI